MQLHIVYRHTCVSTGKSYIGYTGKSMERRWKEHVNRAKRKVFANLNPFYNAIMKHGEESFEHEILAVSKSKLDALACEKILIAQYQTQDRRFGYNVTPGGIGGCEKGRKMSESTKQKIASALKGRTFSEEHRREISNKHHDVNGENNPFFGKKHSAESKEKIADREYIRGADHHFYGKTTGGSFREGKEHPRSQPIIIEGIEYESLTLAAKALGLSRPTITRRYLRNNASVTRV